MTRWIVAFDREGDGACARLVKSYTTTRTITGRRGGRRKVRYREQFSGPSKGDALFRSPFVSRFTIEEAETAEEAICQAKQRSASS